MKIKRGDFTIHTDEQCCWITRTTPTKKGTFSEVKVAGYCRDFNDTIKDFAKKSFRKSDATSMKKLLEDMKQVENELIDLIDAYLKAKEQSDED